MNQQLARLYGSTAPAAPANAKQLNIQVLERLGKALSIWKDTSVKKVDRVQELKNADDICAAFEQLMRPDMPKDERLMLMSIFTAIRSKVRQAVRGEVTDFGDAVNAINFLANCMKE